VDCNAAACEESQTGAVALVEKKLGVVQSSSRTVEELREEAKSCGRVQASEMLPAGMDVKPASQRPGRRSLAGMIAAPCPMVASAASCVEGTSNQEAREHCASVRVRQTVDNVRSAVSRGRTAWKEPSTRPSRSTRSGCGDVPLRSVQSENRRIIPVEMATPWLTDA
jgi:hypothetical protein